VLLPLKAASVLVNLSPRSKEARVVDAFTRNKRVRAKMVALMKAKGYGRDDNGKFLPDDADEWLLVLLEVAKVLLPLLIALL
jgi:hypothetical protein